MLTLEGVVIRQDAFELRADLDVPDGARVSVIGPSGAGKTTLLNVIAGFFEPSAGRVLWDGRDISRKPPGERGISLLFQDNNLFPHLTVAQNVGLGIDPGLRLTRDQKDRVAAALERVGLAGMGARKPGQLSGGQQGRAGLARILVQGKPLILLDEPFAALGPALRAEMLGLVEDVASEIGATLLMVSHDPGDARRLGGLAILVAEGRAEPPVEVAKLLETPPPALRDYLGH